LLLYSLHLPFGVPNGLVIYQASYPSTINPNLLVSPSLGAPRQDMPSPSLTRFWFHLHWRIVASCVFPIICEVKRAADRPDKEQAILTNRPWPSTHTCLGGGVRPVVVPNLFGAGAVPSPGQPRQWGSSSPPPLAARSGFTAYLSKVTGLAHNELIRKTNYFR
jgi:hypothetical protein